MSKEPLYWSGPLVKCDVCVQPYGDVMYDAKLAVRPGGIWGNVCEPCFQRYGCGLGLGRGQKYVKQADGRFLCVEGRE